MDISGAPKTDNKFPLSFYYRIADQLITQANQCRDEQNTTDLYTTLNRYCSLLSIVPQHRSYSTYSAKEKLHHNKIHEEYIKELEYLKPQLSCNSSSEKDLASPSNGQKKLKFCQKAETENQSCDNKGNIGLASAITLDSCTRCSSPCSTFSTMDMDWSVNVHLVTQSSPSPALSYIQNMPQASSVSHITVADSTRKYSKSFFQDIHISARLMEDFLELASDNTKKDLETCGVLAAFLKDRIFYVTTLIIPKQESTSNSCQAINEEEIYAIQDEHSLFPLGWIHTHPSQTCFMSSIDLHTQFSYQVMLPEAVAVVMAPTDSSRSYGIFRLSVPGGIDVLRECDERGFHSHQEPSDGSPIYEDCSNVYINPNLRFEIFDLR
ncbi:JAB/MPN domain [Macleaya cordata]|uniref:JAB/MPN domain n=1 Tax=Macleaya cordata TaxID=56857 RepID=A0A200QH57_MACCD|nr:JAB/MPN domain [Macleaya cordata]